VVLKRLEGQGYAERLDRRHYALSTDLTKQILKAARKSPRRSPS
jgi:hypothetical protein